MNHEDRQAPLLTAVRRGDRKEVQALLSAGADLDAVFTPRVEGSIAPLLAGYTPLMIAAADGDAGLVRDLLAAGARVNAVVDGAAVRAAAGRDVKVLEEGRSALMLAADAGATEAVQALLAGGAELGVQDLEGNTALSLALHRGHEDVIDLLQSSGAGGESPRDALVRAVQRNDVAAVREALAGGADPDGAEEDAACGTKTPLLVLAARNGNREIVEALLSAGAFVNSRQEGGPPPTERSALMAAAEAGHTEVVLALLHAGADPELKDRSFVEGRIGETTIAWSDRPRRATALILAAERGHVETVDALLKAGADVNGRGAGTLPTPLLASIEGLQSEVVRMLLQRGADVEAGTRDETPLSLAVANHRPDLVEALLARGADPVRKAPNGLAPLEIARLSGYADLEERLIQAGAVPPPSVPEPRAEPAQPRKLDRGIAYIQVVEGRAVLDRDVEGDTLVLVRAGVEEVAAALRRRRGAAVWIRDAQGKQVSFSSSVCAVLRLAGQSWSIVRDELSEGRSRAVAVEDARGISQDLGTDAIYMDLDAEAGAAIFHRFRSGEEVECYGWEDMGEEPAEDPLVLADRLLREQDAFVPVPARGLSQPAGREVLQIPGGVQRVDLLVIYG